MNQRKLGTVLSYVQIIVSNTISLIYTPFMLRMMGQSEYGLYGTANSFISYLSVLSFGIGGAYIRFNVQCRARQDREEEKRINGMFLVIFSCLSVLVFFGGLLFIALAGELVKNTFSTTELFKLRVIMLLLTINMTVTFICNTIMMALQAYEKFVFIRVTLIIIGILNPILNVIALKIGGRVITITFISVILSCLSYLIFFVYVRKIISLQFSFRGFRKSIFKELFIFSSFLFINSLTDQITFSTDNIVLSSVKGTVATAIYTVGATFKGYFQNFSSTISSVFAPKVNMLIAKNDSNVLLNDLFINIGRIQFYITSLILIGYISLGKSFIKLWAGNNYQSSYWIGLLLMLAVYVPSFQGIGLEIQKAMNLHKARSIVYFLIAIINVLITIPASIQWGGIGAAMATTICMFCGTVLFMNWYYYKIIKLDIIKFWKSILSIVPGMIIPIIFGFSIEFFISINSLYDVLIAAVIISLIYIISIWKFSMNSYEKNLILVPIKRFLSIKKVKK